MGIVVVVFDVEEEGGREELMGGIYDVVFALVVFIGVVTLWWLWDKGSFD